MLTFILVSRPITRAIAVLSQTGVVWWEAGMRYDASNTSVAVVVGGRTGCGITGGCVT